MTLVELEKYFNSFLKIENFTNDISLNGIQIQNSDPKNKEIQKVAFAVDASLEAVNLAVKEKADALFVHHGIFWGQCETLTSSFYDRVATFVKNDIALFAYHIPLDANNPYGNNYSIAKELSLTKCKPFGSWRGMTLGVKGEFKKAISIDELSAKLSSCYKTDKLIANKIFAFGKDKIKTCGIISGGAADDVEQAVAENLDCFITGEFNHELFHYAKENKINVIAGGHYQTETFGVNAVMEKLAKEKKLQTVFLDIPTGL